MAKNRMINTRFWSDNYIAGIDPLEKLLFLYLITNQYTNICGIYEIPIKQIALDTGIDRDNLEKVFLPRLTQAGKIYYIDGWVYIKNFAKHQLYNTSVQKGIERAQKDIPAKILAKVKEIEQSGVSLGSDYGVLQLQLQPELQPELQCELSREQSSPITKVFEVFYKTVNPAINFGNKTSRKAVDWMIKKWGAENVIRMAEYACSIQGQPFAPVITTPFELKERMAKLKIYHDNQKNNSANIFNAPKI